MQTHEDTPPHHHPHCLSSAGPFPPSTRENKRAQDFDGQTRGWSLKKKGDYRSADYCSVVDGNILSLSWHLCDNLDGFGHLYSKLVSKYIALISSTKISPRCEYAFSTAESYLCPSKTPKKTKNKKPFPYPTTYAFHFLFFSLPIFLQVASSTPAYCTLSHHITCKLPAGTDVGTVVGGPGDQRIRVILPFWDTEKEKKEEERRYKYFGVVDVGLGANSGN